MQHPSKSSVLQLGLIVLGALAILTAVEFAIALTINIWQILSIIPIIKAGLVFYYYMHIYRLFQDDSDVDRESFAYKVATNRLGLWLFLISDSFIFGGLMISRINLLGLTRPELIQVLGLAVTIVLLISSFFANRAEISMEYGDQKGFIRHITVTISLGILFLVGVLGVEWRLAPFGPDTNLAGAVFYIMTGFHAFHVLTGVIFLAIVLRKAMRGLYSAEKHWGVEASVVYWHFVDVVWFFFYPALYLIGTLAK
jgi:cytochrome c oxidase subunit III